MAGGALWKDVPVGPHPAAGFGPEQTDHAVPAWSVRSEEKSERNQARCRQVNH